MKIDVIIMSHLVISCIVSFGRKQSILGESPLTRVHINVQKEKSTDYDDCQICISDAT